MLPLFEIDVIVAALSLRSHLIDQVHEIHDILGIRQLEGDLRNPPHRPHSSGEGIPYLPDVLTKPHEYLSLLHRIPHHRHKSLREHEIRCYFNFADRDATQEILVGVDGSLDINIANDIGELIAKCSRNPRLANTT